MITEDYKGCTITVSTGFLTVGVGIVDHSTNETFAHVLIMQPEDKAMAWAKQSVDATSKGHVAFLGNWEYFTADNGDLYRASASNYLDVYGYRSGARFECTAVRIADHMAYLQQAFSGVTQ